MRSVGGPVSIVATIITLVLVPAINKDGKVQFRTKKVTVSQLKCERGMKIPASPEARRLGVVGKICRSVIPQVRVLDLKRSTPTKKAPLKRARTRR